ncbi:hypothetical protein BN2537_13605 [Streptomyces venezuelae]|nr:hypothetical protein BN2537_13605 [Streptomyces venezuelae]
MSTTCTTATWRLCAPARSRQVPSLSGSRTPSIGPTTPAASASGTNSRTVTSVA